MSPEQLPVFEDVDFLQVGARNMQNFDLLKAIGKTGKPVLLKRGLSATIKELLMSAEYVMASGNENVILCERGIRTYSDYLRNTLDLSAVPMLHELTLPVNVRKQKDIDQLRQNYVFQKLHEEMQRSAGSEEIVLGSEASTLWEESEKLSSETTNP